MIHSALEMSSKESRKANLIREREKERKSERELRERRGHVSFPMETNFYLIPYVGVIEDNSEQN